MTSILNEMPPNFIGDIADQVIGKLLETPMHILTDGSLNPDNNFNILDAITIGKLSLSETDNESKPETETGTGTGNGNGNENEIGTGTGTGTENGNLDPLKLTNDANNNGNNHCWLNAPLYAVVSNQHILDQYYKSINLTKNGVLCLNGSNTNDITRNAAVYANIYKLMTQTRSKKTIWNSEFYNKIITLIRKLPMIVDQIPSSGNFGNATDFIQLFYSILTWQCPNAQVNIIESTDTITTLKEFQDFKLSHDNYTLMTISRMEGCKKSDQLESGAADINIGHFIAYARITDDEWLSYNSGKTHKTITYDDIFNCTEGKAFRCSGIFLKTTELTEPLLTDGVKNQKDTLIKKAQADGKQKIIEQKKNFPIGTIVIAQHEFTAPVHDNHILSFKQNDRISVTNYTWNKTIKELVVISDNPIAGYIQGKNLRTNTYGLFSVEDVKKAPTPIGGRKKKRTVTIKSESIPKTVKGLKTRKKLLKEKIKKAEKKVQLSKNRIIRLK